MHGLSRILIAAGIAAITLSQSASATIIQVASRAALSANLTIDWSAFGAPGTGLSTPLSRTVGSEIVTVSSSQGALSRHQEGFDFTGNFAIGDQLLSDAGSLSDSFSVRFGSPVRAAGTQIERHAQLGAFTAHLDFFTNANVLLGEVTVNGVRTTAEDNSAVFIGGISTALDIDYLLVWVDNDAGQFQARSGDLLINRLDVAVPAPGGIAVLIPMLGLFAARHLRTGLQRHGRT